MKKNTKTLHINSLELDSQVFVLQKELVQNKLDLSDLGSHLPGSLMVHELEQNKPIGVSYMNPWGCAQLGTCADQINTLGPEYYQRYFVKKETKAIVSGMTQYVAQGDFSKSFNFFQRVKLYNQDYYAWFYSICKIVTLNQEEPTSSQMIILSSPLQGMDRVINRVKKVLNENDFITKNYKKFSILTKQEKVIICQIAHGNSSKEIAENLCISTHTVQTHRKNILRKIQCSSFADLIRFAMAFELV